ncbi:MAG: hypothetical protein ACXVB4_13795 [Pseudobdellovibrionaceae bacterium]
MQSLIVGTAIAIGFSFLSDYIINQKKQIGKTVNAVSLHFALNSTMDYVLFGIRQKYCFTDDDLLMNAPTDQCNLVHTGSVERLIMSSDQENSILQLLASGTNLGPVDTKHISLKSISRYIKISSATSAHPLFPILQSLNNVKDEITGELIKIDGVSVTLARDESGYLPITGREVYLKITIGLKMSKTSTSPLYVGSTPLTVSSQIAIYPREVGSFALMVPKDLHLDTSWNANLDTGDVSLHKFGSKGELGTGSGLVFLSPVFVNQDIYLPEDKRPKDDSSPYTGAYAAVTFGDRVYLGNGWIKNPDGSQFEPRSSGAMTDRYWSDIPTFGGFLRGIENDGGLDKGLQVLGKVVSGQAADMGLMSRCIERSQNLSSSDYLYQSQFAANLKGSTANSFKYRLFLTNKDQFVSQTNAIQPIQTTNWGSGTATRKGSKGGPIMNMVFAENDKIAIAQLTSTSTVTLIPEVGSAAYRSTLEGAVSSAQSSVDLAKEKLNNLNTQLTTATSDLSKLQTALSTEQAKPVGPAVSPTSSASPSLTDSPTSSASPSPTASPAAQASSTPSDIYQDPNLISSLQSQILAVQKTVTQLQSTDIPAQSSVVASSEAAYVKAQTDLAVINSDPPKIVIEVAPVKTPWSLGKSNTTYNDRVDISMTVSHADHLIDSTGNLVAPSIGFLAYDGTYFKSTPIKFPANGKLFRYLNFGFNSDKTSLIPPTAMSATSSSSAVSGLSEDDTDNAELDALCEAARNTTASQSFGGASWNVDFSGTTRSSWNFAGDETSTFGHDPVLDKTVVLGAGANGVFKVYSIAKECVITSSASLITGFYTCDSLRIEARQTPLRIIGTFIVGKLQIDPSAYKAGITWSSIYHPQVTPELRAAGVLKSVSGASCDAPKSPIWHPIPSIQEVADRMACNVISLRAKANPFQWTAVDPDCGLLANSSNTTCKHRLVRFFVVEQSREGGR